MAETTTTTTQLESLTPSLEKIEIFWQNVFQYGEVGLIADRVLSPDYTFNGVSKTVAQVEAWCRENVVDAYKERNMIVHKESFAGGTSVALYWTFSGIPNDPAKDKATSGINILKYDDKTGMCVSNWQVQMATDILDLRGA